MEYCLPRIITTRLMSVQRQWVVKGLRNKANLLIRAHFFVGGFCNSNCKNSISQNIYKYTSLFLTKYYKSAILITFHPQTWEYFIHLLIVLRPKFLIIIITYFFTLLLPLRLFPSRLPLLVEASPPEPTKSMPLSDIDDYVPSKSSSFLDDASPSTFHRITS